MADCLRRERVYSEKRPRDLLFAAIERLVEERRATPVIVSRLTREAAARARQQADASGFTFLHWDTVSRAVVKAMLGAGALLTADGRPIAPGITAQANVVAGVDERFRDLTEAFLLEVVITRLMDVTMRDHTALAHALFRQFDRSVPIEELEDRVVVLMAQLADRIELRGDWYCARDFARTRGDS
ncbi:MAG: hypothetical protein ABR537_04705 [Gemmatimonadales bacterium]